MIKKGQREIGSSRAFVDAAVPRIFAASVRIRAIQMRRDVGGPLRYGSLGFGRPKAVRHNRSLFTFVSRLFWVGGAKQGLQAIRNISVTGKDAKYQGHRDFSGGEGISEGQMMCPISIVT